MQSIALQASLSDRKGNRSAHNHSPNLGMLAQSNAMFWRTSHNDEENHEPGKNSAPIAKRMKQTIEKIN
jgi:hypothetical protein